MFKVEFESKLFLIKNFRYKRLVGKKKDLIGLTEDDLLGLFLRTFLLGRNFLIHLLLSFLQTFFHFFQHLDKESNTLTADSIILLFEWTEVLKAMMSDPSFLKKTSSGENTEVA